MPRRSARTLPHNQLVEDIRHAVEEIERLGATLSKPALKKTRELLAALRMQMDRTIATLDPVREPTTWFDPADPNTSGRLVAAALLAQDRIPLDFVSRSYGAGVYAIYYSGEHPIYAPISKSETPIYVGKADPASPSAKTPREQGERLYGRLADHRKMIRTVEAYALANSHPDVLRIANFDCRRMVTATNAQIFAETHLISLFKPVWNAETRICWGISMHGDVLKRENSRPPWDVLHPGRSWAMRPNLAVARPATKIVADIAAHFATYPAYRDRDQIIELFMEAFSQDPLVAGAPVVDDEPLPEDDIAQNDPAP
jgi:Eco29kI restriction endonuclease